MSEDTTDTEQTTRHADDEPVMVNYSSSRNISFRSTEPEDLGIDWGQWRKMNHEQRNAAIDDYVYNELIEVSVVDDED